MEHIKQNLKAVRQIIAEAAEKSGRTSDDITFVGVTKTQPPEAINFLINEGVADLGENRVQEFVEKYPKILPCKWHFIGNLQKNKIRYIIDKVILIQSVDSLSLVKSIDTAAKKAAVTANILLEVNIAGEATKHGIAPEHILETAKNLENYSNVCLSGIMTMAPYTDNPETNRNFFKKMFQIYVDIRERLCDNSVRILSMGTSGDYATAIEEGSNMVRVGTGVFGRRNNTP